jgi:hypothetical protein
MITIHRLAVAGVLMAGLAGSGCGSGSSSSSRTAANGSSTTSPAASGSAGSAGVLSAEAQSAATGDIPDNQVFLVYQSRSGGFSMKYPEGWTQSGAAHDVTFRDKNNLVHVVVSTGPPPTPASVVAELRTLGQKNPALSYHRATMVELPSGPAVRVVYTTESAPNPVTGRRVQLIVDRYALANGGRTAIVDLGTPKGVDNVDAYRMMIESFRWR